MTRAGVQRNAGDDAHDSTVQSGPVMLDDDGPRVLCSVLSVSQLSALSTVGKERQLN